MSPLESTPPPEPRREIRRPGPHGADARNAEDEEAIARAYRRAEKAFEEVKPRTVHAAEAVTSLEGESRSPLQRLSDGSPTRPWLAPGRRRFPRIPPRLRRAPAASSTKAAMTATTPQPKASGMNA